MGAATAHLGAIGRKPTDFATRSHTHFGQDLSKEKNSLATKTRNVYGEIGMRLGVRNSFRSRLLPRLPY